MSEPHTKLSLRRIMSLLVPVAIVALLAYLWSSTLESAAQREGYQNVFTRILNASTVTTEASASFTDKDGDLVADPPEDPAKTVSPEVLVFANVASRTDNTGEEAWRPLMDAIAQKTGREVKYVHYENADDQLKALKDGELQIAVLATGVVPVAVKSAGFVPLCTFGNEDGHYGYKMNLIVPADSQLKKLRDVKGHMVMFSTPDSNSGCKALLTVLKNSENLQPDRDYKWGFSGNHEDSIKGVADKKYEAAPVASDIVERMVAKGELEADQVRSIYESERFPPATIGYVYNLSPELRTQISEALIGFSLAGTKLEGEFGSEATKLVPVNYKDDWANIRAIDQLVAEARKQR